MIVNEEIKKRAQKVGLDLTKDKNTEITSGYLHFEKNNSIYEEDIKFEASDEGSYIKTKFSKFNK